jgi:hypothetical protein
MMERLANCCRSKIGVIPELGLLLLRCSDSIEREKRKAVCELSSLRQYKCEAFQEVDCVHGLDLYL